MHRWFESPDRYIKNMDRAGEASTCFHPHLFHSGPLSKALNPTLQGTQDGSPPAPHIWTVVDWWSGRASGVKTIAKSSCVAPYGDP